MRTTQALVFLTFVLSVLSGPFGYAAKPDPSPDFTSPPVSRDTDQTKKTEIEATIDLSQSPSTDTNGGKKNSGFFYPYRRALTFRAGYGLRAFGTSDDVGKVSVFGTQFMYQLENRKLYEFGADLLSDGSGTLHAAWRRFFSRGEFRPFAKIGAGLKVIPRDRLATFLRVENYHLRASAGVEVLVYDSQSLRLELETNLNTRTGYGLLSLGYVLAW